jgi:protease II
MTHVVISLRGQLDIQRQALRHDTFKKEVLNYMENENKSAYKAAQHFSAKHKKLFQNWNKNKDRIRETHSAKKRAIGGGRKPTFDQMD